MTQAKSGQDAEMNTSNWGKHSSGALRTETINNGGREHHTNGYQWESLSEPSPIEPSSGQNPRDPHSHQMHRPLESGYPGGEMGTEKAWVSPGHCHLTYCDSVIAQEALHSASAILDKQGLAQVLEGERLGWVKAVMVFCNKDPD